MYQLLQTLPGYTRTSLEAEDAALVDDWLLIMRTEAHVQKEFAARNAQR